MPTTIISAQAGIWISSGYQAYIFLCEVGDSDDNFVSKQSLATSEETPNQCVALIERSKIKEKAKP